MDINSDASSTYSWVDVNLETEEFPVNVLRVGRDKNGEDIFLGRAYYENDLIPAKVVPIRREAYVAYGGKEIRITKCEVLIGRSNFDWTWDKGGHLPEDAFNAGITSTGEALYVGRVAYKNTITPGKIHPSQGCCYFPYDGKELKATEYDCLVYHQRD